MFYCYINVKTSEFTSSLEEEEDEEEEEEEGSKTLKEKSRSSGVQKTTNHQS